MRAAYLVVGPEGSGTYMLWEALVAAGCGAEPGEGQNCAVRYSLPHAGSWPDLAGLAEGLSDAGFAVQPLIILREWNATVRSVLRRDPERGEAEVEANMRRALVEIGKLTDPIYFTYEAFCLQSGFRAWLFDRLGLEEPPFEIKFANWQYYGV